MIRYPPCSPLFPYTTLFRSFDFLETEYADLRGKRLCLRPQRHTVRGGLRDYLREFRSLSRRDFEAGSHEGMRRSHAILERRVRSEEHTSELQSPYDLVCRLL